MIRRNHYKRRMPVIAKLSQRTMDRDFRYARDWGTKGPRPRFRLRFRERRPSRAPGPLQILYSRGEDYEIEVRVCRDLLAFHLSSRRRQCRQPGTDAR